MTEDLRAHIRTTLDKFAELHPEAAISLERTSKNFLWNNVHTQKLLLGVLRNLVSEWLVDRAARVRMEAWLHKVKPAEVAKKRVLPVSARWLLDNGCLVAAGKLLGLEVAINAATDLGVLVYIEGERDPGVLLWAQNLEFTISQLLELFRKSVDITPEALEKLIDYGDGPPFSRI